MKLLFWILSIVSILISLFVSILCYMTYGLELYGTEFGLVVCFVGMLAAVVCIVCLMAGIIKLRKGDAKKALAFALAGLIYCGIVIGAIYIDDAIHTTQLEKSIAERNEQLYGEGWDAPPAIEGIPDGYQDVLNRYYVVVRDTWPANQLMELGAVSMAEYYGNAPLENIGFALMDLNGDNVDELVIGSLQGGEVFCIYTDPSNPSYAINSVEGQLYYLHAGQADGSYKAEIVGRDASWIIETAETENTFDFNHKEGALDPAARLPLALTPFSEYK